MQNGVQTENCSCGEMCLTQKVDGYFTSKNERRTNSGITETRYSTPVECADIIQDLIWSRIRRSAARFPVRAAKTDRDDSSFPPPSTQQKKKWLFLTPEMQKPARGNIQVMAGVCLSAASGGLTWSASQWGATKRLSSGTPAACNFLQIELQKRGKHRARKRQGQIEKI